MQCLRQTQLKRLDTRAHIVSCFELRQTQLSAILSSNSLSRTHMHATSKHTYTAWLFSTFLYSFLDSVFGEKGGWGGRGDQGWEDHDAYLTWKKTMWDDVLYGFCNLLSKIRLGNSPPLSGIVSSTQEITLLWPLWAFRVSLVITSLFHGVAWSHSGSWNVNVQFPRRYSFLSSILVSWPQKCSLTMV